MKTLLFLSILLTAFFCAAQSARERKADKMFADLAYADAACEYAHLSAKKNHGRYLRRLAQCYMKMNRVPEAVAAYSRLIATKENTAEDLLAYSAALRSNGMFDESQRYLEQYCTEHPQDSFARRYFNDAEALIQSPASRQGIQTYNVTGNGNYSDFAPMWFFDQLLFVSSRNTFGASMHTAAWNNEPYLDIYVATPEENGDFSTAEQLHKSINSRFHEGPLALHPDNQRIYFTRNNYLDHRRGKSEDNVQKLKIYTAVTDGAAFSEPEDLAFNNDEYSTGHPSVSADGKWLFFCSDMPGGFGGTDIYRVALSENGMPIGAPLNLGSEINTPGNEMFPFYHVDGLLFFASNGWPGYGGLDIFVCEQERSGNFVRRMNIGKPANSEQDDFSFILNSEQTAGYFASDRPGGVGGDDIYRFTQQSPFGSDFLLNGFVVDERSGERIPFATVSLYRDHYADSAYAVMQADENGFFSFSVEPEHKYDLSARQTSYFYNRLQVMADFHDNQSELQQNIPLIKDPGLSFLGVIADKGSSEPLSNVTVVIKDRINGDTSVFSTAENGSFRKLLADKRLDDQLSFTIKLEKEGYLFRTVEYVTLIEKEGEITWSATLEKAEVGSDLGKIIDLSPIYFDYAKYTIRPDAARELDKIVKVLNDNPNMTIELGAHTDSRGTAKSNELLSEKRARSSAEYIRSRITNPERVSSKGYGESMLLNDCGDEKKCSEVEHQLNRRTEFRIKNM